ncbi:MAG: hypothetical protein IT343_05135 [Candidatus Melainabacteria bacterium]|jgi:hypothetical protein|nr:hypothetical protein [Candidatus Melainabacteria bacterium]
MNKLSVAVVCLSLPAVFLLCTQAEAAPKAAGDFTKKEDLQQGWHDTLKKLSTVKTKGQDSASEKPIFTHKGAKSVDGLILQQEYRYVGKSTTYFSPLGIRLDSNTLSILFNSKTLAICIFSDETKKYYACDPDTWKKKSKVMFENRVTILKQTPWKFVKDEKICGMATKAYSRFSYMNTFRNEDTIWVTKEIALSKDANNLLFSLLKVMGNVPEGVPLRHQVITKNQAVRSPKRDFLGRRRERLRPDTDDVDYQTYSVTRAKIPVSKYALPPGYKKADTEMEVFFNTEESLGGLDGLDGMSGLDSPRTSPGGVRKDGQRSK